MSLILEALKKSEQQRRIGQAPNLATPVLVTRRRRNLLPALALLIVAAVAIGAWLRFFPSRQPTAPAGTAQAPGAEPEIKLPKAQGPAVQTQAASAPATSPAEAEAILGRPLSAYEKQRLKITGALPASALKQKPIPPKSSMRLPPPPAVQPPASASATPATAPAPSTGTAAATGSSPNAPKPAASPPPTKANLPAIPYLWELPYATRKDMPPLQISMHVYADKPADRFVVIDGETYAEGDEVGEGLTVKEIRADGAVLDAAGKLFLLPAGAR